MRIFRLPQGGNDWHKEPVPDFPVSDGPALVEYMLTRMKDHPYQHWLVFSKEEENTLSKIGKPLLVPGRDPAMVILDWIIDQIGRSPGKLPLLIPVTEHFRDMCGNAEYLLAVVFNHPRG